MATFLIRDHTRFLATRISARDIRLAIEHQLARTPPTEQLDVDFTGVIGITVSGADELMARLLAVYRNRVRIGGMSPEVADAVNLALSRRRINVGGTFA